MRLLLIIIVTVFIFSCNSEKKVESKLKGDITIFHAGSMAVPLKEIADSFKLLFPDVNILMESAGSRECARKITDLKKHCDIMVSADYAVINELLMPTFTDWNIKFATNEMVIAYTEKSKMQDKITKDNWYELLQNPEVRYGRSDPNADPCGYRTVLTFQLQSIYINNPQLADKFTSKDEKYIRPKEVDLLGLLESSEIDYIFIYKSVAEQHKLKYITLPDEVNLKNSALSNLYSNAKVEVVGKKPGQLTLIKGEPMIYSLTLLKASSQNKIALEYMKFFLDKSKGLKIIEKNFQQVIAPSLDKNYETLPDELKSFINRTETNLTN